MKFEFTKAEMFINRKQNPKPVATLENGKLQIIEEKKEFYCFSEDAKLKQYVGITIDAKDAVDIVSSDNRIARLSGVRIDKGPSDIEFRIKAERILITRQ